MKDYFWNQSLAHKLITKWFWLYLFTIFTAPSWYLIRVILSNSISVEDVWIIYSIIWLLSLISIYNDLWLTNWLQYFLPKLWIEKKYGECKLILLICLWAQIVLWSLFWCLIYFGSDFLALHYFHSEHSASVLKYFAYYFFWINIIQVFQMVFLSFQNVLYERISDFIRLWATVIFAFTYFVVSRWNIDNYAISFCSWVLISLIVTSILFMKEYDDIYKTKIVLDIAKTKEYIRFSFWMFLTANVWILFWQIDQQMIVFILWPRDAGFYSNYLSLVEVVSLLSSPIINLVLPLVVELNSKGNYFKIIYLKRFLYKYFSLFALSFWWLLFVLWPTIAMIFFWIKFQFSWQILMIATPFLVFKVLWIINFWIITGIWDIKAKMKIILVALIVNIITNITLINMIWIPWSVIASVIWWLIIYFMSNAFINKENHIKSKENEFEYRFQISNFIFYTLLLVIIYFIKDSIFAYSDAYRYQNFVILAIVGGLYYILIAGFNYEAITHLKNEILKIKNKH